MIRQSKESIKKIKLLRSQGFSVPEISSALSVPKTTVFYHVKGVQILPDFLSEWAGKRGGSKKKRLKLEAAAFKQGKELVGTLSQKEKVLFLCALYWAEGSKRDFGLSNTDPELIKTFVNGLRDAFHLREERFKISIRIYEDLDKEMCLDFWSSIVKIPKDQFLKVDVLPGKKQGKLKYGMCRVRITKGANLLKNIVGVNKAIAASFAMAS